MATYSAGSKISVKGTIIELMKNEAVGSRYRIAIKSGGRLVNYNFEEDEFTGSREIDEAVAIPAKIESVTDDTINGTTLKIKFKAADTLQRLTLTEADLSGVINGGSDSGDDEGGSGSDEGGSGTDEGGPDGGDDEGGSGGDTSSPTVSISAVAPGTTIYNTNVDDMQSDVVVANNTISGTLTPLTSGDLVDEFGTGYFLTLQFDTDDWTKVSSVLVGLDPAEGTDAIEIADTPDKNGVFKITNVYSQILVVNVDGVQTEYDLSGLLMA